MERPILFSNPMVKALLDGRKTQTRRIVKIPDLIKTPDRFEYSGNSTQFDIPRKAIPYDDRVYHQWRLNNNNSYSWVDCCPYGKIGDILWVKEMYYAYGMWLKNGHTKSGKQKWMFFDTTLTGFKYHYQDDPPENILPNTKRETYGWFKRSSLFMPYKACRIKLPIIDIRVERVQDISEADAIAEGIGRWTEERMRSKPVHYQLYYVEPGNESFYTSDPVDSYQSLWTKINGKGSWDSNPWVWVIQFKIK